MNLIRAPPPLRLVNSQFTEVSVSSTVIIDLSFYVHLHINIRAFDEELRQNVCFSLSLGSKNFTGEVSPAVPVKVFRAAETQEAQALWGFTCRDITIRGVVIPGCQLAC